MDEQVAQALKRGGIADITTTGRKSGEARRIEINFHRFDGENYITGSPGKRGWLANLKADPEFTVHLKRGVVADVPATAEVITDQEKRSTILYRILTESWSVDPDKARRDLDRWVGGAPLIRFTAHPG